MNKAPEPQLPPDPSPAGGADVDPWNEFLSEAGGDLHSLSVDIESFASEQEQAPAPIEVPAPYTPPAAVHSTPVPAPVPVPVVAVPARLTPEADAVVRHLPEGMAPAGVSLADLMFRQTPVHWSEAVAVVEELCTLLQQNDEAGIAVPEPPDIVLTASGTVAVRRWSAGTFEVAAVVRLLHGLLTTASTPLPLRLFVTASASSERYRTVALFADALSLYAAPLARRADLIRALYVRSADASAVTRIDLRTSLIQVSEARARRRRLIPLAIAATLTIAVSAGGAFWFWQSMGDSMVAEAAEAGAAGVDVERPGAATPARRDDWQTGTILVPSRRQAERQPLVAAVPALTTPPSQVAPVVVESRPVRNAGPQTAVSGVRDIIRTSVEREPQAAAPPRAAAAVDPTVYSREHRDVQPPVMITPLMPPPADFGSGARVSNTIEFTIDEEGRVAGARYLHTPERMIDATYLSAAKLTKFRPATKDGVPVKYLLLIDWGNPRR